MTFPKSVKCVVREQGSDSIPSVFVRDCCARWHFIFCEGSKVGCCCLWFICCCFSSGSCRGVGEPVLCLNVSGSDRERPLCPLSYVQYAPTIVMDRPLGVHIMNVKSTFYFKCMLWKSDCHREYSNTDAFHCRAPGTDRWEDGITAESCTHSSGDNPGNSNVHMKENVEFVSSVLLDLKALLQIISATRFQSVASSRMLFELLQSRGFI